MSRGNSWGESDWIGYTLCQNIHIKAGNNWHKCEIIVYYFWLIRLKFGRKCDIIIY